MSRSLIDARRWPSDVRLESLRVRADAPSADGTQSDAVMLFVRRVPSFDAVSVGSSLQCCSRVIVVFLQRIGRNVGRVCFVCARAFDKSNRATQLKLTSGLFAAVDIVDSSQHTLTLMKPLNGYKHGCVYLALFRLVGRRKLSDGGAQRRCGGAQQRDRVLFAGDGAKARRYGQ